MYDVNIKWTKFVFQDVFFFIFEGLNIWPHVLFFGENFFFNIFKLFFSQNHIQKNQNFSIC